MNAPQIYRREQWGALQPKGQTFRLLDDIQTVFAHYSDTHESIPSPAHVHDVLVVQAIQRYHMNVRGFLDIAYAALIGGNGDIYLGRPNFVDEAATLGHNHTEWSVCMLTDDEATDAQWESFEFMLWLAEINFPNVLHVPEPHSHAVPTACPGDPIRARLAAFKP